MTNSQYLAWADIHGGLFVMRTQADEHLFSLWAPVLTVFDFEELRAASYAVSTDSTGRQRWRENHLAMLREVVLTKRAEAAARANEQFDRQCEASDCQDCHGVGVVRAPHHERIIDGELQGGFFVAVACTCANGTTRFNAVNSKLTELEDRRRMMDLREYEGLVPDWRGYSAAYAEAQHRQFAAAEVARQADRVTPIIVGRDA